MSQAHEQVKAKDTEVNTDQDNSSRGTLSDCYASTYTNEYIKSFVEKWDSLIDWEGRASSEGSFFIDILQHLNKHSVLDVATGTGYHSVNLLEAGFDVTSVDGSAAMLMKAFENGQTRGHVLKTVHTDWRWLGQAVYERFDAIICLGNSFTHLHDEVDRRRALAEFYAALKPDGILIIDQRNYDYMLDNGFKTKHKFYYCGDKVTAKPVEIDEQLAKFQYTFADGEQYMLNLYPLRKNYLCKLLREAGFEKIQSFGDFEAVYDDDDADFFIHVVEKSAEKPMTLVK